ncbi:MAG: YdjY domain-containing protein [Planctomycetaceae bacterium]
MSQRFFRLTRPLVCVCFFPLVCLVALSAIAQDATKPAEADQKPAAPQGLGPLNVKPNPPADPAETLQELGYQDPTQKVLATLADPPGAKRLSKRSSLWVDVKNRRVYVDGYVSLRDAPLEMFACPVGTKEHESIVATLAKSSEVHAALLAVGAVPGTTVKFDPKYIPATGQRIRVWVMYRDPDGKFKYADARSWVRKGETNQALELDWVFAGSINWTDPQDGKTYYQADGGDLICVSNFGTAMMDLPIESSDSNSALQYTAFTNRIPPDLTPVRLMLVPIPIPSDRPADPAKPIAKPDQPPEESLLPLKPAAK